MLLATHISRRDRTSAEMADCLVPLSDRLDDGAAYFTKSEMGWRDARQLRRNPAWQEMPDCSISEMREQAVRAMTRRELPVRPS